MKTFTTPDIATAAYLLMKGFKLLSAEVLSGRYQIKFEDPDQNAQMCCIEYINYDCSRFDSCMRGLRSMLRDQKN